MSQKMGYRATIQWLVGNDDTEWVNSEHGSLSVTASLVADIFGVTDIKVTDDLKKRLEKVK